MAVTTFLCLWLGQAHLHDGSAAVGEKGSQAPLLQLLKNQDGDLYDPSQIMNSSQSTAPPTAATHPRPPLPTP